MLVRGLWGIQIGPQSDQVIKVEASFRITMASIFEFNGPERTSVYVRFQDATFLLCSLIPEKIEQQVLDITCLQGEEITLRVDGPNVIHLLGNYISQNGIDDQKDDEIGFLELNGSDVEEPAEAMLKETPPAITFPVGREGLGFDESDEFESNSESQAESDSDTASESETMSYDDVARLASYVDRLSPTASPSLETTKDMEEYIPPPPPPPPAPLNAEGAGRYVLINSNASVGSSAAESEPFDQQSDTSGAVADQASLSDSQHHVIKTEEQDNMGMDTQSKQMAEDDASRSKHESSQEPEHGSEQSSEQVSEYEPEVESEQVSEYEPDQMSMDGSDHESDRESEHEVKQEPQQEPQQVLQQKPLQESYQEPHQEQEHESQEQEPESEHKSKPETEQASKDEPAPTPVAKPTSVSAPEPTQQPTAEPAKTLPSKPEQTTKAGKKVAKSNKQQKAKKKSDSVPAKTPSPSKKKSDSIPANTPSPIKKKADKAAKKQAKKLAAALAKQQESKADSNKDADKEKKAQENKEKNKIKAKKISKKKQALANNNQASSQNKSTEGASSQDIRSLVLGAFANMAAAIQSAATAQPSPKPSAAAPKFKKIKVEQVDQDGIPEVVASKAPKRRGRPPKPKVSATPAVSQNDQTQSLDASDPGTVSSTQPKKKKKAAKKPNVAENDTSTAAAPVPIDSPAAAPPVPIAPPAAAAPVSTAPPTAAAPVPIAPRAAAPVSIDIPVDPPAAAPIFIDTPTASPIVIDTSRSSTSSPTPSDRVRYPRKAVDIDSMQKLALFAQEDAKSADDVRKERKKKKKSQRADETVAKKARLSIE